MSLILRLTLIAHTHTHTDCNQVVLIVIEALQRAKEARWDEAATTHKVVRQLLMESASAQRQRQQHQQQQAGYDDEEENEEDWREESDSSVSDSVVGVASVLVKAIEVRCGRGAGDDGCALFAWFSFALRATSLASSSRLIQSVNKQSLRSSLNTRSGARPPAATRST